MTSKALSCFIATLAISGIILLFFSDVFADRSPLPADDDSNVALKTGKATKEMISFEDQEKTEKSQIRGEEGKKKKKKNKKKGEKIVSKNQLLTCPNNDNDNDMERWSDRSFPTSSVKSLFNCNLPDALCTYYYPANFFDEECGLGGEYAHFTKEAEEKRLNGTLWNFMPSVGFPTLTMKNVCFGSKGTPSRGRGSGSGKKRINPKEHCEFELNDIGLHGDYFGERCTTERLSFLHVHKAGGSSLHSAFNFASAKENGSLVRHKFFTPSRNPGTPIKGENGIYELAEESLTYATKYPDNTFAPNQHVILAVVRDPTERFISSIGQAMGATGSQGNHIAPILKEACIKDTPKETLRCIAEYVRDNSFWIELHFTPQVLDMSFTTLWKDVPIAVFSFQHLKMVLEYFDRGDTQVRKGSGAHYRSDPILKNMTVADYDDETLEIVCGIYEMDVRMQRSLGIEVPRCDPFIPKTDYNFQS